MAMAGVKAGQELARKIATRPGRELHNSSVEDPWAGQDMKSFAQLLDDREI